MRRLTTYEYNNTVRDLLGDTTNPGSALPAQVDSKQNPFGNDADEQSPTDVLVEKYQGVAESIAARATANATALGKLHSCASNVTAANEEGCARMIATSLAPRALRRTVATTEIDELVTLYRNVRALSTTLTFASGVAAMIEALLQSPEFLYRVELGKAVTDNTAVKRVAGREIATRLSYLFWQTMPDAALFQVADAGMLDTKEGVQQQAQKMLDDPRSHPMVAFFFDNLLPIPDLSGLTREAAVYPTWSGSIGAAMRTEVQRFLEHEIYENTTQVTPPHAPGSWPAILTAPYTYVNQALFNYYGASTFAPGTYADGHGVDEGRPEHHAAPRPIDPGWDGGGIVDQQPDESGPARRLRHQQVDVPQPGAAHGVHADAARSLQRQDRARAGRETYGECRVRQLPPKHRSPGPAVREL